MGYDPQPVDIPIYGLNQVPPGRSGPSGRLLSAKNAQVRRFVAAQQTIGVNTPAQIQLDPRDGMVSFPAAARSVVDGTPVSLSWNTPQLLDSLGDQLVDIVGGSPRVQSGAGWTSYPNNTIVTRTLSQDVFHVAQRVMQVTDFASLAGVLCSTWTESIGSSAGPLTTTMVGFKASDGAWLVKPTVLFASTSAGTRTIAKVVSDGGHFFVAWNDASLIHIGVYDTNGVQLGTTTIGTHAGIWDITAAVTGGGNAGSVIFAQAQTLGSNAGVFLTSLGWSGSAVTAHSFLDNTIQCAGPLGWMTNDTGNGLAYLATGKSVSGPSYEVHAYEITNIAQVHDFNSGVDIATTFLDNLTGFAVGSSGTTVVISMGTLAQNSAAHGPPADPQLRFMQSFSVDRSNAVVQLRNTQSLAQVSRAFAIDGNYYSVGYYQSGSGTAVTPVSNAVSITAGDFMLGADVQPVTVAIGDNVQGSPIVGEGGGVQIVAGSSALGILGTDSVSNYTVVAGDPLTAWSMPVGTQVLKWVLGSFAGSGAGFTTLSISGCSEPTANGTWEVWPTTGAAAHTFYTALKNDNGGSVNPATFSATGTAAFIGSAIYNVKGLASAVDPSIAGFYSNLVWANDTAFPANDGTWSILRMGLVGQTPNSGLYAPSYLGAGNGIIIVVLSAQGFTTVGDNPTWQLLPSHQDTWTFAALKADNSYVGSNLVVSNDGANPANNGTWPITSISGVNPTTGGQTTLVPEFFSFPLPTVAVELGPTQVANTFKLQSLFSLINYTYQNALISVQGAAESVNNGVYQIQTINSDGTFIATRTDQTTNQVNEQFTGSQTITVFFAANISPIVQATWFLVPLTGTQPIAGRWEYGSAYADWRIEGDATLGPTLYPMALASPAVTAAGISIALPFRAQNVTESLPLVSSAGEVPFAEELTENTVGIKIFTFGTTPGQSFENTTTLMIPGPLSTAFTQSGFFEAGIGLAPEPPFLVSQSVASNPATLGLQLGGTYLYQLVSEFTDENGDLIESIPSQVLTVTMSGTNNVAKLGGRVPFPLSTTGQPIANTYGPITRNVTLSLYRTAIVGGIPTTQKYKITNDLSPNQLTPISTVNPSGFIFPDAFTWNYIDCNPDIGLTDNQDIYTDGELPRYAPPAFSRGIGNYLNRDWVLAYDGSLWMSAEHIDGQAVAWNLAWRWQFPATDKPKTIGFLENSLFVFCERTVRQIPLGGASLPTPAGGGSLPTPITMRFPNGSKNGYALSIPNLVVYDSTAGGVWAINESLENVWLSHPVLDDITGDICGLALDGNQKLYIQQTSNNLVLVYDHVPGVWGGVVLPTTPTLIGSHGGQFIYQDTNVVSAQTPGVLADNVNGVTYGIPPDITFASVSFGSVRGLKMIWGVQAVGQYLGAHRINIVISYPDDGYPEQIIPPFTPTPGTPYIIPFYLANEEVTSFGLRIYADFVGVPSPAGSFSLELLAAEVGIETGGLAKLKDSAAAV